MITAKIKVSDFPLFYDENILKQYNLSEKDIIEIVYWIDWQPNDVDSLEMVKNYYCADFYYPQQFLDNKNESNNFFGKNFDYDTFPIEISKLISIEEK